MPESYLHRESTSSLVDAASSEFREFEDTLFIDERFNDGELREKTFRHCTFANVSFLRSKLLGCQFFDCVFWIAIFGLRRLEVNSPLQDLSLAISRGPSCSTAPTLLTTHIGKIAI